MPGLYDARCIPARPQVSGSNRGIGRWRVVGGRLPPGGRRCGIPKAEAVRSCFGPPPGACGSKLPPPRARAGRVGRHPRPGRRSRGASPRIAPVGAAARRSAMECRGHGGGGEPAEGRRRTWLRSMPAGRKRSRRSRPPGNFFRVVLDKARPMPRIFPLWSLRPRIFNPQPK